MYPLLSEWVAHRCATLTHPTAHHNGCCPSRPEQIRVGARPGQIDRVILKAVDQQPVGFDVAVPETLPVPGEGVVPTGRVERPAFAEGVDDGPQLGHVPAALP